MLFVYLIEHRCTGSKKFTWKTGALGFRFVHITYSHWEVLRRANTVAAGGEGNDPIAHPGLNSTTRKAGRKDCRFDASARKAAYSCVVILSDALKAARHGLGIQA